MLTGSLSDWPSGEFGGHGCFPFPASAWTISCAADANIRVAASAIVAATKIRLFALIYPEYDIDRNKYSYSRRLFYFC